MGSMTNLFSFTLALKIIDGASPVPMSITVALSSSFSNFISKTKLLKRCTRSHFPAKEALGKFPFCALHIVEMNNSAMSVNIFFDIAFVNLFSYNVFLLSFDFINFSKANFLSFASALFGSLVNFIVLLEVRFSGFVYNAGLVLKEIFILISKLKT